MRQMPAAFGITKAGVVPNMVLGGLGGGAIGGADAAVRSNGDLSAIERGAGLGGAFGALGPARRHRKVERQLRFAGLAAVHHVVHRLTRTKNGTWIVFWHFSAVAEPTRTAFSVARIVTSPWSASKTFWALGKIASSFARFALPFENKL